VVGFKDEEHMITDNVNIDNYQYYADKAKHVQIETQKQSLKLIKNIYKN